MLIGICGGIGSGKSVLSRILREVGYTVYDCDLEARRMMESSERIKQRIRDEISPEVTDGVRPPDRKMLAEIVFSNEAARLKLNEITHGELKRDLQERLENTKGLFFTEAAIIAESGLAQMCDEIWRIEASREARIQRIMQRDGCTRQHTESWMAAQTREEQLLKNYSEKIRVIYNYDDHSLMKQAERLLLLL